MPGADLVVWNGHTFVVVMQNAGWWDSAKMIWKYGLAPIKTIRLMRSTVGKFLQMYKAPIFPFESLNQAAEELGLLEVTAATGEQFMAENGITGNFGRDVVQASTRVNYATNLNHIHGLEAMVCMAAEGGMAVQGGNWQIFDSMIGASDATTLFNTEVTSMNKERGGRYAVTFEGAGSDLAMQATTQQFDSVILAAPNQFANVDITPRLQHMPDKIPYVKLHVTLFTSPHLLSSAFFGLPANKPAPRAILTTLPKDEKPLQGKQSVGSPGFFSISLLHAVTNPNTGGQEYAYKIFSTSPPNSTFLTQLLGLNQPQEYSAGEIDAESGVSSKDITWMYRKIWSSYPYEYPRVTFEPFKLDDNLWYTSAIESFISTMETSALAGMNVARLVMDKWREELGAVKYGMMLEKEMIGREAGDV